MNALSKINVPARLENLDTLVQSITSCAKEHGFIGNKLYHIELAVEEVFVNICNYAYPGTEGDAEVKCRLDNNNFVIEFIDSGIPFDITSMPGPDITKDIPERPVGGLGIFFMKKMMDDVRYRREGNKNILCLVIAPAVPEGI